jgi:hypothetical protein
MRYLISALIMIALCGQVFSQTRKPADGKRPFRETEKIDTVLLQSLVNKYLGEQLKQAGARPVFDDRIVQAANYQMRHPEITETTDENGFYVAAVKVVLMKNGYACGYVLELYVEAKSTCPTIRSFDASDTYENVAARFVDQFLEGNRENVTKSGYDAFGAGVYAYEDWERNESGPILNEPKCTRVKVLFVFL